MRRCGILPLLLAAVTLPYAGCAAAAALPKTQFFDADGVKIAYFVQGEGEPVVLIHGWLSSAGINWVLPGTVELLAKDYKVIGFDVPAHGLSDKPTDEKAYGDALVEDVVCLLDRLKIEKAHIVGYSMGSIIAGNFIAKHPERVYSGMLGGMGWLQTGSGAQWFFSQVGKRDKETKAQAVCGRSFAKLALSEDEMKSIHVPMTVLVGADDKLVKKLYVDPLKKLRPDWPVIEIKDAGHFTCIVKEDFRKAIAEWLKRNPVRGEANPQALEQAGAQ